MARSSYLRVAAILVCALAANGQGAARAPSPLAENAAFRLGRRHYNVDDERRNEKGVHMDRALPIRTF